MTLGQRIQELRKEQGLSQEALGEKLGVSRQAISKWEGDGAVPEVDKLIALSRLFGFSLNELLQVDVEPGTPEDPGAAGALEAARKRARRRQRLAWAGAAVGCLALVLGLTALTVSFGRTAGELADRVTRLEARVEELEAGQSGAALGEFRLADVRMDWSEEGLLLTLVPERTVEGLSLTVQVARGEEPPVRVEARQAGGTTQFQAQLSAHQLPAGCDLAVVAALGEAEYTLPVLEDVRGAGRFPVYYTEVWQE